MKEQRIKDGIPDPEENKLDSMMKDAPLTRKGFAAALKRAFRLKIDK
jgi:hypothetical protein